MELNKLVENIINGYEITKDEAMKLWNEPYEELARRSEKLKRNFCGNSFDLCTIISAKSGKCSEDCTYCAQSIYYETM